MNKILIYKYIKKIYKAWPQVKGIKLKESKGPKIEGPEDQQNSVFLTYEHI